MRKSKNIERLRAAINDTEVTRPKFLNFLDVVAATFFLSGAFSICLVLTETSFRGSVRLPLLLALTVGVVLFLRLPSFDGKRLATVVALVAFVVSVIAFAPFLFMQRAFNMMEPEPLLFYLPDLWRGDASSLALELHTEALTKTLAALLLIIVGAVWLSFSRRHMRRILLTLGVMLIGFNPLVQLSVGAGTNVDAHALIAPERDVREPLIFPRENLEKPIISDDPRKNLILAYFEGFERSFASIPSTRSAFSPVLNHAEEGLEFRGIRQLAGLEYSIAGLVASQCGVPLIPHTFATRFWSESPDARIQRHGFMPALDCLGGILSRVGYQTVFLNGSDLTSFSIRAFLQSHGFQHIIEERDFIARGNMDAHVSVWGYDDFALMERVWEELERLADNSEPFLLSFLTIGTHGPDGVLDSTCGPSPANGPALPLAVDCASRHLTRLLERIELLGLMDNTIVAVLSDHLIMQNTLQAEFDALDTERENLFFLLGPVERGVITREASMLDVFPTLLDILGLHPSDGAAGLGRSLLQPAPTLVEQLGQELASAALFRNFPLSRHLWRVRE